MNDVEQNDSVACIIEVVFLIIVAWICNAKIK